MTHLEKINSPEDLKQVKKQQLPQLCQEIRNHLVEVCSANGGHLGSNMGIVELSTALHYVFDSPKDKIIYDITHQGYVHKILTGRRDYLKTLRQTGGCSGFLQREESEHDHFGAGHAGTALSAGLGFAAARDRKGTDDHVISIVGDAGLGCGVSLEALNNAEDTTKKFIVILNDNKMSISPNTGALSKYLNRIITDSRYKQVKAGLKKLITGIPGIGCKLKNGFSRVEEAAKSLVTPGVIFEELGFRYIGPVDGHDLDQLLPILESLKNENKPVFLHVLTEKGKGFAGAEKCPEKCHGFKKVSKSDGKPAAKEVGFSEAYGRHLATLAAKDERIVGITAGMMSGTGLNFFQDKFPERTYDTGIAEEHAAVFAAGLSGGGCRPFVGIYATFMQRAMDCVYHDICIQELPVTFCMDRAGLVEDGPTHHGIYDLAFWISMPNLTIMQPRDGEELLQMMDLSRILDDSSVIRYAKAASTAIEAPRAPVEIGKSEVLREGSDLAIWCSGRECLTGLKVAEILHLRGINAKVVNARFIKPFDRAAMLEDAAAMPVLTIEDHVLRGGMATVVRENLYDQPQKGLLCKGYPDDKVITWGKTDDLRRSMRMLAEQIAEDAMELAKK